MADQGNASVAIQKIDKEQKCEYLMELFYQVYDEMQKMQAQKHEFERRMQSFFQLLQEEQNELLKQQKQILMQLTESRGELKD